MAVVRVLLFVGKGGVGKTTTAAATAALAASRGRKALVLSTDPAHSLADAFGMLLAAEPTEVDTGLYGMQVDSQAGFERTWCGLQDALRSVSAPAGLAPVQAEELTCLPGADQVLALVEVRTQVASGRWDLVVVDCPATGEALRLLALPETLQWYVEKIFPAHRRALRAAGPLFGRATHPPDAVLDAVERLCRELRDIRALLTSADTSVRLVLTPEAVVVAEARRTLTWLALYSYRVDGIVANRVFAPSSEPFLAAWAAAQRQQLDALRLDVPGLPVREQEFCPAEPVGVAALTELGAALYGGDDPGAPAPPAGDLLTVAADGDGWVLTVDLPLARREDLELSRSGDELVLTLGGHRRLLALPSLLRRCILIEARLSTGRLRMVFQRDPRLWPETLVAR